MAINFLTSLIPNKYHQLWLDYLKFAEWGGRRFAYEEGKEDAKENKLFMLEKALRCKGKFLWGVSGRLKKEFSEENLAISLLTDWLIVWKYTTELKPPLNEKQISDIIGYAVSPLTRMIMALNDENPSVYLPFGSLVSAVVFLYLMQSKAELIKGSKWSLKQRKSKLKGWIKNSRVLLSVTRSAKLKFRLALLLNRLDFYNVAFQNNKQCHIGVLDEIMIFLYSIWQFMTIRRKSVAIKEL